MWWRTTQTIWRVRRAWQVGRARQGWRAWRGGRARPEQTVVNGILTWGRGDVGFGIGMGVVRDANWIKLDYESQREGQKFLTFGQARMK
jgi:hypothetical protein